MQKVNPLDYSFITVQDIGSRKTYQFSPDKKINALDAANLAFFFSMIRSSGGFDWWGFIQEKGLEKHFTEVE